MAKEKHMQRRRRQSDAPIESVPEQLEIWKPITLLGHKVQDGIITDIEEVFKGRQRILEKQIVDQLVPNLREELLLIGQAKGKFGGGQRRIFRQTQKKTMEGSRIQFATCAAIGNGNGYVGVAVGKSKETVPSREKSRRYAKISLIRIRRGCGSWQCHCGLAHSIPFAVTGKCGSSEMTLMPAPRGKGLCIEKECAKVLSLAGIKDIWSKTSGQTTTKLNLIYALMDALRKLSEVKVTPEHMQTLGIVEGKIKSEAAIGSEVATTSEAAVPSAPSAEQLAESPSESPSEKASLSSAEEIAAIPAENGASSESEATQASFEVA